MKKSNGVRTSKKVSKVAAKTLTNKNSSRLDKTLAGNALSNRRK